MQQTDPYRRHDKRMDRLLLHHEMEFINQHFDDKAQTGFLLDLCCGIGEVSPVLQTGSFRTLGLDINWQALCTFRKHSPNVRLIQGDALNLPFSRGSLDLIVALHCFDLLDREGFLRECSRILRRGGLLIFDALNRHSYKLILKRLGRFLRPLISGRPSDKWIDVFSYSEVVQRVGRAGLDIQAKSGYGWPPFSVTSNSRLVDATASIERFLQLDRFPSASPRFVLAARKK